MNNYQLSMIDSMNEIKDAEEFFQQSAGKWISQRTTHHLPFRRAESGGSNITVEFLAKEHPKITEICQMHEVDPSLAIGGAFVCWDGAMAWDKEGEDHKGDTVFALIPTTDNPRKGQLLRERGYAEIVPVAGHYEMDEEDGLILITDYETMNVSERFWFVTPDFRLRTSTVKRFGGFNTATFCTEFRISESTDSEESEEQEEAIAAITGW